MRSKTTPFLLFLILLCSMFASAASCAEEAKKADEQTASKEEKDEDGDLEKGEKKLSAAIGGKSVGYTVKTGMTPILDDDGEEKASIFSTSYIMDGGVRERPVLFLFNGGPGSASVYLHGGSFAPMYFPGKGQGLEMAAPPYKFEANPHSLLDVADLVFVDPVGTGFSRMAEKKKGDKEAKGDGDAFWGVKGDIESMVEFVRMWLVENDRWGAEIYLAGESYGGLRAAGMASELEEIGVAPSGVVLISPALSYRDIDRGLDNDITPFANVLPTMTAVAHYHKRLGGGLQELPAEEAVARAVRWVEERLIPGLRAGNRLGAEERGTLIREISEYTGIPAAEIGARNMRLDATEFSTYLLRDNGEFIGLYDGRLRAPGYSWTMSEDPTMSIAGEPYKTAFMRFLTETIGIKPKRGYVYSSGDAHKAWDFTLGYKGRLGFIATDAELAESMRRLPFMRVFLAMGRYDLVTPPESALQSLSRMEVPADRLAKNLTSKFYDGGHMMYTNPEALEALSNDLRKWLTRKP